MATVRRTGKPYIHVVWLAKVLGGAECTWRPWFQAHFKYDKYEEGASDLVQWNRDHTRLMARRRAELEAGGWTVYAEDLNAFKLEGGAAIVAGKPDLVAIQDARVLIVDGKTGRERESDIWQVLLYLYAIPLARARRAGRREAYELPAGATLEGEVYYTSGEAITLTPQELTDARLTRLVDLIKTVAGDTPPPRTPSRYECRACSIGPQDCPQRLGETPATPTDLF